MIIPKRRLKFRKVMILSALLAMNLPAANPDIRLVDAVKHSDKAAIQALLSQHIDPNIPDVDGSTALHWASRWDNLETAGALIRGGANAKATGPFAILSMRVS